jgi:N-acetylneuraminic acid mutarotase
MYKLRSAGGRFLAGGVILLLTMLSGAEVGAQTPPGTWSMKAPRPDITNEAQAVAIGGKLLAPGGSKMGKSNTRLDEYDPETDRWRSRADMPQPLDHIAVAVVNGKLYGFGGFAGTIHAGSSDAALEYDPAADTWRRLKPMKGPRAAAGAAVIGGKIHVIGGRVRDHELLATHEVYDPATGNWSEAAPLPLARDHLAVVEADGKIHVIGGRIRTNDDNVDNHDIYDPATNSWSSGPPLPTARSAMGAALYKGVIVVNGGERRASTFDENEGFDVKTGRWATLAPMPGGRHGHGVAVIGNGFYAVGGALQPGGTGITDQLVMFTLP